MCVELAEKLFGEGEGELADGSELAAAVTPRQAMFGAALVLFRSDLLDGGEDSAPPESRAGACGAESPRRAH